MSEEQNQTQSIDVGEVEKNLEVCEIAKNELIELSQRIKADFMNYKKDQDKNVVLVRQNANESLLMTLMPIFDSLELALTHMPKEIENNQWVLGVKSIKSQIDGILKSVGITEISALGKEFDPRLHEVMLEVESDKEDGVIIEELQKGYKLYDKVLRPAKVKVSIKKQTTS